MSIEYRWIPAGSVPTVDKPLFTLKHRKQDTCIYSPNLEFVNESSVSPGISLEILHIRHSVCRLCTTLDSTKVIRKA